MKGTFEAPNSFGSMWLLYLSACLHAVFFFLLSLHIGLRVGGFILVGGGFVGVVLGFFGFGLLAIIARVVLESQNKLHTLFRFDSIEWKE